MASRNHSSPDSPQRRASASVRRVAATLGTIALSAIALTLLLTEARPLVESEADYLVFGTHARLRILSCEPDSAEAALAEAGQQLARDHRSWHPWENSDLTALNADLLAGRARRVDPALADLIRQAKRGHALSGGLFNPAAGRLIDAWGFHTSDYPVRQAAPSPSMLQQLVAARPTMQDVHVGDDGVVSSRNRMVRLDLNAVAEGYAATQARTIVRRHHIEHALLDIGGLVMAMGTDRGQPWSVGVRGPAGIVGRVQLRDGETLSSSGDYQRRRDGREPAGHIIDTAQGHPQRSSAAASIISRDALLADMAGTTLMVGGPDRFDALTRQMGLRCALLIDHQGRLLATPGMRQRLQLTGTYRFEPAGRPADATARIEC